MLTVVLWSSLVNVNIQVNAAYWGTWWPHIVTLSCYFVTLSYDMSLCLCHSAILFYIFVNQSYHLVIPFMSSSFHFVTLSYSVSLVQCCHSVRPPCDTMSSLPLCIVTMLIHHSVILSCHLVTPLSHSPLSLRHGQLHGWQEDHWYYIHWCEGPTVQLIKCQWWVDNTTRNNAAKTLLAPSRALLETVNLALEVV